MLNLAKERKTIPTDFKNMIKALFSTLLPNLFNFTDFHPILIVMFVNKPFPLRLFLLSPICII